MSTDLQNRLIRPRFAEVMAAETFGTGQAHQLTRNNTRPVDDQPSGRAGVMDGITTCLPCLSGNERTNANTAEIAMLRALVEQQTRMLQDMSSQINVTREVNRLPSDIEFAPVDLSRNLGINRAKGQGKISAAEIMAIKNRRRTRSSTNLEKEVQLKDKILGYYHSSRSNSEASSVAGDWLDDPQKVVVQSNPVDYSNVGVKKNNLKKSASVVSFEWDDCGESEMNDHRFKEFKNLKDKELLEREEMNDRDFERAVKKAAVTAYNKVVHRANRGKRPLKTSGSVVSFDWDDCGESEMNDARFKEFKTHQKDLTTRDENEPEVSNSFNLEEEEKKPNSKNKPVDLSMIKFNSEDINRVKAHRGVNRMHSFEKDELIKRKIAIKRSESVSSHDWDDCGTSEYTAERHASFLATPQDALYRKEIDGWHNKYGSKVDNGTFDVKTGELMYKRPSSLKKEEYMLQNAGFTKMEQPQLGGRITGTAHA